MAEWSSAGVEHENGVSWVYNMDLAIYCYMLHRMKSVHIPILSVSRIGRGRHEIAFDDPHDVISKLELEFANADTGGVRGQAAFWSKSFATAQRDLKSIIREGDENARPNSRRAVQP